jgi:hypothetical protein
MADLMQLQEDLTELRRLLHASRPAYSVWESGLAGIQDRLGSPETRAAALKELVEKREYFGGMGSLNDLFFCEANHNIPTGYTAGEANARLTSLLDRIFREASVGE